MKDDDLKELGRLVCAFRDERDWAQFHSLRNLIASVNLEAAELLELTQWQSDAEIDALPSQPSSREALADECADILLYLLLIADRTGIDLATAARHKLAKNAAKYPVAASRGSREKYNRLKHAARSADKD
ncbi:MAG: nucleotide pyrophosphohydrolase [Rhodocyclaceae bacterium]|nr:nucleotide pyrophosphohydrolase [Rhodocyclaceae bacterium]MCB1912249.1 nucleotide pyrophosphohydrolase [Rhodocyclaceae bacterium]MCP5238819.1 nucleotide pyrophosphohydrolase [Zoogloeaceae bacterium]MCP5254294.1 nucleotide pyrophosphohydrolase [Zoogloeaceae bacterium]MCW5614172.1 nucleotide pyrophosphohydrolase [Rhodocyclaceae bacterium]